LERIWKEVVIAQFKVLNQHLPGGIEENHEKSQSANNCCKLPLESGLFFEFIMLATVLEWLIKVPIAITPCG
jgi:hypothetical protein